MDSSFSHEKITTCRPINGYREEACHVHKKAENLDLRILPIHVNYSTVGEYCTLQRTGRLFLNECSSELVRARLPEQNAQIHKWAAPCLGRSPPPSAISLCFCLPLSYLRTMNALPAFLSVPSGATLPTFLRFNHCGLYKWAKPRLFSSPLERAIAV